MIQVAHTEAAFKDRQQADADAQMQMDLDRLAASDTQVHTHNNLTAAYIADTAHAYQTYADTLAPANTAYVAAMAQVEYDRTIAISAANVTAENGLVHLAGQAAIAAAQDYVTAVDNEDPATLYNVDPVPDAAFDAETADIMTGIVNAYGAVAWAVPKALFVSMLVGVAFITAPATVTVLVAAGFIAYGLNAFSAGANRYSAGQTLGQSIGGAVGDVTPIGSFYSGLTNTDIATGQNLQLSYADRGAMLGSSVGDFIGGVLSAQAFRVGATCPCFVGETIVLTGDDAKRLASEEVFATSWQPKASAVIGFGVLSICAIGYAIEKERKRKRPDYRTAVDLVIEQSADENWRLAALDDSHPTSQCLEADSIAFVHEESSKTAPEQIASVGDELSMSPKVSLSIAGIETAMRIKPVELKSDCSPPRESRSTWSSIALAALLLIGLCSLGHAAWGTWSAPRISTLTANNLAPPAKRIDSIVLGDNVLTDIDDHIREKAVGDISLLPAEDRLDTAIDPATSRAIVLRADKEDGSRFDIQLLKSLAWIEESGAKAGETIYLELREQGFAGDVQVLSIYPCPEIKSGLGRTVTGIFVHTDAVVLDLYLDGIDQPLGVTENHRIYSVDRSDFIPAGELSPGERLQQLNGSNYRVARVERRAELQTVYNLEVQGEHVYRVTDAGLLVHNECTGQLHHAISKKIADALDDHAVLSGKYSSRDPRFVTQAVDDAAHRGYQTWHRNLDKEVADFVRSPRNQSMTADQFEAWLRQRYNEADLKVQFPDGL